MEIVSLDAHAAPELEVARSLFREYQRELNIDLCFQGFEEELRCLPSKYAGPDGLLLLGLEEGQPAGCVAVRPLEENVCEMKRLFVRVEYRGRGFGRALAEAAIRGARAAGHAVMRLDTLESLKPAMQLYQSLGFNQVPAYYRNPLPGVIYWELKLSLCERRLCGL